MSLYKIIKPLGFHFHNLISKSKLFSRIYIDLLGDICHILPNNSINKRILNSINSIQWINFQLKHITVQLGNNITFQLIPHLHEFDSEAIVTKYVTYEQEVFAYLETSISEYDSVIEIGGNVGIFSLFFYEAFLKYHKNPSKIFIFEPSQSAYLRLLENLQINSANQIQTYNCAVGDEIGFLDFFEPQGHLTNGSLNKEFAQLFSSDISHNKALVINGNYLSHLVSEGERILVKIDVEGSEVEVLSGMKEFIFLKKPTLIIEVLSTYQDKLNTLTFLHENYYFYNLTKDGLIQYDEFEATQFRDYILLPKQEKN